MRIILTDEELEQCKDAADRRTKYARSRNITNQRFAKDKSDRGVDYIGMVGEMAVAKALGLEMDLEKVGVDYGIDFMYRNLPIDVKTRSHPKTELIFKSMEYFKSQVAVVAKFKPENCVEILGCISRKKFRKHERPTVYECIGVPKELLSPIETLINYKKDKA